MKRSNFWIGIAAVIVTTTATFSPSAMAQRERGLSARGALDLISERFGAERVEWIVEMRGWDGVPEPEEWEVDVWDPRSRYQVREYWAGDREATNEGSTDDYYPARSPFGFIRTTDLKLDSKAAFVIAEAEARKAKMGFDALNYTLRCREFSREPVWTLELLDASGGMAGKVYISGSTGEVLRTVWIFRGERGSPGGGPLIVDSAAPREGGEHASTGARSEPATGDRYENQPPLRRYNPAEDEPDPLAPSPKPPMTEEPAQKPPVPPSSSNQGTDTRIPPPPIPPAP
ncbi:MAG: hypothetical protein KDN19_08670 [Verrucomicrobiae bacterium]|nr:hypothetical protein [Verrucomicrobiae bacterium]